ncbi:MAG TPA: pyridoxal-phosphate dependent enzyme, partial [Actinomycetes bacterium]
MSNEGPAGRAGGPATATRLVAHPPDALGHFGPWGGRFVPEVLMAALDQLTAAFEEAVADPAFLAELDDLRRDYAGRPTPLTPARRLSEELGLRLWLKREDLLHTGAHKLNNSLGSVLNHVLLHQTVIGLELKAQLEHAGIEPDVLVACIGGGSNFGGFTFPLLADKLAGRIGTRVVAVEPTAAPTLTKGRFDYDLGDQAGMTPLIPMYTLGSDFIPAPIHAGGLRYHGDSPIVSLLAKEGHIEAVAYPQSKVFEAAVQFARTEGHLPA